METNHEGKRVNGTKYLLRRRVSAKLGSDCDRGRGVDGVVHKDKKLKRWQEGKEEGPVVEQEKEFDGRRTGCSSSMDGNDAVENGGRSEMGDGTEGEESVVDQLKGVSKTHNDGKTLDDCSPSTVPRKLRSAMNKRNRESVSPPLPELKKQNASKASKINTMAHPNGTKKSKHVLVKHANAVVKPARKSTSMTVTKAEEEVAEALYVLSRLSPARSVRSKTDSVVEEEKPSILPEDKASKMPSDFPTEASSKKVVENAVKADVSRKCVEVHASAATNAITFIEKLDPESETQIVVQNNFQFNNEESAPLLTDVQNDLVLPCSQPNSENKLAQSFTLNLLPPYEAEKGSLQPENLVSQGEESTDGSACIGSAGVGGPVLRHNTANCLYNPLDLAGPTADKDEAWRDNTVHGSKSMLHLDLSKPPSTQDAAWLDSTANGTVVAVSSANKDPSHGKKSWKRCATHVHLSYFIHRTKSVDKVPRWSAQYHQPSELNGGVAKATCDSFKYKDIPSCSLTTASLERNSHIPCLQLLPEKTPVSDQSCSRKPQGIDFLSLSQGGADRANNLGKPNKGAESSMPVSSSCIQSVQHQSVSSFSVQGAPFSNSFTYQQPPATAAAQQVLLPQYLANPFLNPHYAAAAMLTSPAVKQQQQLWSPEMMHYYQPTQFPKPQNGRNEGAVALHPCSQSSSLAPHLTMAYAHSSQLFPVSSSGSKRPPQQH